MADDEVADLTAQTVMDDGATPPSSPQGASPEQASRSPPVDPALARRQEGELEQLEKVVEQYAEGVSTLGSAAGRDKILAGTATMRKLWLEFEAEEGVFHGVHAGSLLLCRAAAKLLAKPDDGLAAELLQLGGDSTLGPLFRVCGSGAGAAERGAEVRHYASNLMYRMLPSKIGIEWVMSDVSKVSTVTSLFGDQKEPGAVREHAAAVLQSFSRIAHLQSQLCAPDCVQSFIATMTMDDLADEKGVAQTLRRYAGTILADLCTVPEMHDYIAEAPAGVIPPVIELLRGLDAVDAPVGKRTAASILSSLSQDVRLQRPIVAFGGLAPLLAACGQSPLEPQDLKLQL